MGSKKGLPTKRKMVSRLNKSGKLSTYSQRYHLNPFKRTGSTNRGGKSAALANSTATKVVSNLQKKPAINRKASIDAVIKTSSKSSPNGIESTKLLSSKIKSDADVKKFTESYLNTSLQNIGPVNNLNAGRMTNEHSLIVNNIPENETSYNEVVSSLINNRESMDDRAFSTIVSSFSNHDLLESVLKKSSKKVESYDREDLLHD